MDPITVLIEADARGLQTQLTSGMNLIKKFVSDMNSQQLNWEKILAGSLDLAIISGIAATFAQAIATEVAFQTASLNLNNLNTPATQNLSTPGGTPSSSAFNEALASGASLGDSTAAIEAFSKAGLDSAASLQATTDAAGIARDTNQSMGAVVAELVPLFQNWGVTTQQGVTDSLTGLANAAQNGSFSFNELVDMISSQGANLSSKTDISKVAIDLATLSTQSGLTKSAISDSFTAIGEATANGVAGMDALLGGPNSVGNMISSGPNGLITAFSAIKTKIDATAPAIRQTIGYQMGLASGDTSSFSTSTVKGFTNSATAATKLTANLIPLNTLLTNEEPLVAQLGVAWNNLNTQLSEFIIPAGMSILLNLLTGLGSAFSELNTLATSFSTGGWTGLLKQLSSDESGTVYGQVQTWFQKIGASIGQTLGIGVPAAEANNNPGDLKQLPGSGWAGSTGTSLGGFAQFSDFATGFQALQTQLQTLITNHPNATLSDIIAGGGTAGTYAGFASSAAGNNPVQYAAGLAQQLNVSVSTPISALAGEIQQFARAIAVNEDNKNPGLASIPSTPQTITNNTNNNNVQINGSTPTTSTPYYQALGIAAQLMPTYG